MFYIIGKEGCPYCDKALDLMEQMTDVEWEYTNVYENPLVLNLMKKAGLSTVPQIWLDNEYIGGYAELYAQYGAANTPKEL